MINSKQLLHDFITSIDARFGEGEITSIAYLAFESVLGLTRQQIITGTLLEVSPEKIENLTRIAQRVNNEEPIQYILGEAYFYGRKFSVNNSVLIPRPETEELVSIVIDRCRQNNIERRRILDIGTGSGCLAITLALEVQDADVSAIDVSRDALHVARQNAEALHADLNFYEVDFLSWTAMPEVDTIVSNPPYISVSEKHLMSGNVTNFEPHMALFVDDGDPLLFYRAIAKAGSEYLSFGGFVAVEINQRFGKETRQLFLEYGYRSSEIIKDISGNDRFVVAFKN